MRNYQTTVPNRQITSAESRITDGNVFSVSKNGNLVLIEYLPKTTSQNPQVMAYAKENGKYNVWHDCACRKSGYAYGCWHLGLIGVVEGEKSSFDIEIVGEEPPTLESNYDISKNILGYGGNFQSVKYSPGVEDFQYVPPIGKDYFPEYGEVLSQYGLSKTTADQLVKYRSRQIERFEDQAERISSLPEYFQQEDEVVKAIDSLVGYLEFDTWDPVLLIGPKGVGKSLLAHLLGNLLNQPVNIISGHREVDDEAFLGIKTLESVEENKKLVAEFAIFRSRTGKPLSQKEIDSLSGDKQKVVHQAGIIMEACQKGEIVFIDEINAIDPSLLMMLNTLIDWQRQVYVPGVGSIQAHEDFRLIAACNEGYSGTNTLGESFIDRFSVIRFDKSKTSPEIILSVIKKELKPHELAPELIDALVQVYIDLHSAVYSSGATLEESCISIRNMVRAGRQLLLDSSKPRETIIKSLTSSIEDELYRKMVADIVEMRI